MLRPLIANLRMRVSCWIRLSSSITAPHKTIYMAIRRCTETSSSPTLRKPRTGRPEGQTRREKRNQSRLSSRPRLESGSESVFKQRSFFTRQTTQLCPNTTKLRAVRGIGNNPLLRRSALGGRTGCKEKVLSPISHSYFPPVRRLGSLFRRTYSDWITG